jgi:hypothetical protein
MFILVIKKPVRILALNRAKNILDYFTVTLANFRLPT